MLEGLLASGWLGNVAQLLTALVAAIALFGLVRGLYRRTLGRRRDRYARLERLGTNAQISFFSSALGEPPAMRRTVDSSVTRFDEAGNPYPEPKNWIECIWIDRDYYVHAVADEDETIHAYSVTTRSLHFRPKFRRPGGWLVERGWFMRHLGFPHKVQRAPAVKLGKTRFHELGRPESAATWIGAHNFHYFETYWGANPGLYQHFVYSINDAGYGAWDTQIPYDEMNNFAWGFPYGFDPKLAFAQAVTEADAAAAEGHALETAGEVENDLDEVDDVGEHIEEPLPAFYEAFRHRARINTYTVIGPELALDDYPFFTRPPKNYPTVFGPSSVRTRTVARGRNT